MNEKKTLSIFEKDEEIYLHKEGINHKIEIKRCFPWSEVTGHLSLQNDKQEEIHYLADFSGLDSDSIRILGKYLSQKDFCFQINSVMEVKEDVELRHFFVSTKQGERVFQTKLEDWPIRKKERVYIKDLSGDIYIIANATKLDDLSKKVLSPYND